MAPPEKVFRVTRKSDGAIAEIPQSQLAALDTTAFSIGPQVRSPAIPAGSAQLVPTPPLAQRIVNRLPDYGGFVGSFMGVNPAMRTANAARLGVVGRALSHDINALTGQEQSWTPQQAVTELANVATQQGGRQFGGEVIGGAAGLAARPLMSAAMRNPAIREGVDAVAANLKNVRAPVGRLFAGPGSNKAIASVAQSAKLLRAHLADMAQNGVKVDQSAAIDRAYHKLSDQLANDSGTASETMLNNLYNETIAKHGKLADPRMANLVKQRADLASKPVLRQIERGQMVDPSTSIKAQWDKALADELRGEIESASGAYVGVKPSESPVALINKATQERIAVANAIGKGERASRPPNPTLAMIGTVGAGVPAGLLGHSLQAGGVGALAGAAASLGSHAAMSPEFTSRLALMLTDPHVQNALRQGPRAFYAAQDATGGPR